MRKYNPKGKIKSLLNICVNVCCGYLKNTNNTPKNTSILILL